MKQYNGEKAIISLTSWKARITTVDKTIFSLLKNCPGFHIVLVLAEEEFTNKENDLPDNLKYIIDDDLIEVIWVKRNWKSIKKVIFTIEKYKSVPIISADDDCIYVCNYAEELYQKWLDNNKQINPIAYRLSKIPFCLCGPASFYPPELFDKILEGFKTSERININMDDSFISSVLMKNNIKPVYYSDKFPCYFHDETEALTGSKNRPEWVKSQRFE